jgi:hypothetical protein
LRFQATGIPRKIVGPLDWRNCGAARVQHGHDCEAGKEVLRADQARGADTLASVANMTLAVVDARKVSLKLNKS